MKKMIAAAAAGLLLLTACTTAVQNTSSAAEQQIESAQSAADGYEQITQDEAKQIIAENTDVVILDVRTQEEFNEGHIPGAICIPNETIGSEEIPQLPDKQQTILVYCRSGRRSKEAAAKLAALGFTSVKEFGGIIDWTGSVVTDPQEDIESEADRDERPAVTADWEEDLPDIEYDEFGIGAGSDARGVIFAANENLTDFTIVSLQMKDAGDDGVTFEITDTHPYGDLTPDKAVLVRLSFPGDMPSNGIIFTDSVGNVQKLVVAESGRDGSIAMYPFE